MQQLNKLLVNLYYSYKGYFDNINNVQNEMKKEKLKIQAEKRVEMQKLVKELFVNSKIKATSNNDVWKKSNKIFIDKQEENSTLLTIEANEKNLLNFYKEIMSKIKVPLVLNLLHKQFEEIQTDLIKLQEIHITSIL